MIDVKDILVFGRNTGADFTAWKRWYSDVEDDLVWRKKPGRFVVDARAARSYRSRLQAALRK